MKRRNHTEDREVEDPRVDAFLAEIVEVCRKHGMSIDHEDTHGNFIGSARHLPVAIRLVDVGADRRPNALTIT